MLVYKCMCFLFFLLFFCCVCVCIFLCVVGLVFFSCEILFDSFCLFDFPFRVFRQDQTTDQQTTTHTRTSREWNNTHKQTNNERGRAERVNRGSFEVCVGVRHGETKKKNCLQQKRVWAMWFEQMSMAIPRLLCRAWICGYALDLDE